MSLESLLVDINLGLFKYLDSLYYLSVLGLNKPIFCNIYPQILAGIPEAIIDDVTIGGLQISFNLLSQGYPCSLFHLLAKPNFVILAAKSGNLQMMELAVSHGGNPQTTTQQEDTPLHFAAGTGNELLVKFLVQNGARVKAKNENNLRPLHYAALYKQPNVIPALIHAGASVDCHTFSKRTPLHYACMHAASVSETTYDPHKHLSASSPRFFHCSFFRGRGGMKNSDLLSILPVPPCPDAELRRQIDAVRLLLTYDALPSACDERSLTPLHYASFFGPVGVVQLLIAGPDVPISFDQNTITKFVNQSTKLTRAQITQFVDHPSFLGFTALFYACAAGNLPIVQLLLALGARTSVSKTVHASRNYAAHSALSLAIQYNQVEVVRALAKTMTDAQEPIIGNDLVIQALKCQNREIVRAVLEREMNLAKNHPNLLQYVICHCNESDATYYTALFLERGAQARAHDEVTRATPLHLAVAKNYTQVVRMLVDSGADVNVNDKMYRSALDMTLGPWNSTINLEIINILLQKPITNIDQKDFMGNTILHRAVKANNLEVVQALVKKGADIAVTNKRGVPTIALAENYQILEYLETVQKNR
eukprot:Phypoly_transcript_05382.p1 GENE.Phypoly_transcript_05382~~Phypoly_transcript_05382.p1  ORF type:complete len:593 (+),score=113.33 Phypoly_transcript_05382:142-1920(+)